MTVEISTLPSGLRVATETVRSVESVSLGVWVDVGTRYESRKFHGISHLLEHMVQALHIHADQRMRQAAGGR